jgi:hypothetical protein
VRSLMGIRSMYTAPIRKGREFAARAAHSYQNNPRTSVGDYAALGAAGGAITGGVLGTGAGVILPPYLGWKLADYLGDKINLGWFLGTALDVIGAVTATLTTIEITVPVLAVAGVAVGAATGLGVGSLIGAGKKGLEAIVG